jgi:hypothetical protein
MLLSCYTGQHAARASFLFNSEIVWGRTVHHEQQQRDQSVGSAAVSVPTVICTGHLTGKQHAQYMSMRQLCNACVHAHVPSITLP